MGEIVGITKAIQQGGFIFFLIFLTLLLISTYGYTIKRFLEVLQQNSERNRSEFAEQRNLHERVLKEERISREKLTERFETIVKDLTIEIKLMNKGNGNR